MFEISKQPDAYRQRIEREALYVKQAQDRLVSKVENAVALKFAQLFGNGNLTDLSSVELVEVEGPTSSITLFDGTITTKGQVMHDNKIKLVEIPVKVAQSEFELNDEDLRQQVTEAQELNPKSQFKVESIEPTTIEADLSSFRIKDDGEDHYKIYHPALDLGRELTTVAKNEYEKIENKEILFKDALQNQVTGSDFDGESALKFTGSFVEPEIERQVKNLGTYKKASLPEDTPEEDRLIATIGDRYRQSVEAKERQVRDSKDRLVNHIVNAVVSQLRSLRYGSVKIASVNDSLEYNGANFTGAVELKTNLISNEGPREIILPLEIKESNYKLLRPEAVKQIIAEGIDTRAAVADQVEQEVQDQIALVDEYSEYENREAEAILADEKSSIKKRAADEGGVQWFGETTVLKLPKQNLNLPDDIAIGTVISADGAHWKLISKSEGQLSKGVDDGSIYTFAKVEIQDKEPEHKLGR